MLIPTFNLIFRHFPVRYHGRCLVRHVLSLIMVAALTPIGALANTTEFTITGAHIITGTAIEGGLIFAKATPGAIVSVDGTIIPITPDGYFVTGFHRDHEDAVTIDIQPIDKRADSTVLVPMQREYNIQRIDGLAQTMVTPPAARIKRIKRDSNVVRRARARLPAGLNGNEPPDFFHGFDWPVVGRISGVYGGQRILNGEPRQPHYGVDIAAPLGTAVRAPADGVVTLAEDLYYSGWTIIIAHGLGVNSGFLHLRDMTVDVGAFVKRGSIIGHVGSSGRSTGPHLDWRIDWQGRRIDASLIANPMPLQ